MAETVGKPPVVELGNFVVGEIPDPLLYQFQDALGVGIDLTGASVSFDAGEGVDAWASLPGTAEVDTDTTKVRYAWQAGDLTAGSWSGRFTVDLVSGQVYKSVRIIWYVETP